MIKGGYIGRILRIDLSSGSITTEPLPPEKILRLFMGGTGLAVWYLNRELGVDAKPFDPENPIILMTGPLTGTPYPNGNDTTVVTLNATTKYTVGDGHTHGFFGPYMKMAGYDGVIITGAAKKWVYLWICDDKVEIRDASHLVGLDTHQTEDAVKAEVGYNKVSVGAIGQAGEHLVHGSGFFNDKYHCACKASLGAVLGSKKLKAIAIKGNGEVPIADPPALLKVVKEWHDIAFPPGVDPASVEPHYHATGQVNIMPIFVRNSWLIYRNMTGLPTAAEVEQLHVGKKNFRVRPQACWSCSIACSYRSEATFGPHKGYVATLGGGGENQEGAAFVAGILDCGTVEYLTDRIDRYGMDSADPGSCLGLALELYERGIITKEQTGGLELRWGNAKAVEEFVRQLVYREGFGALFSDGATEAARKIGGDAPKYVIAVKGGGYNYHDWRPAWGIMLGQATAGAGPCWQGSFGGDHRVDPDLGISKQNPPFTLEWKREDGTSERLASVVARSAIKRVWEDEPGICFFGNLQAYKGGASILVNGIKAVVGWDDFTFNEGLTIGRRTMTLERIFNMKRGLTIESDMDVSPRLLEAPNYGRAKGQTVAPHLHDLIKEFYVCLGWDRETGKPTPETLKELSLEEDARGL